ncbi:MAG: site-specific integrase [Candidatus Micrarchaeota archaeon]
MQTTRLENAPDFAMSGYPDIWALIKEDMKPERKHVKLLWAPAKHALEYFARHLPKKKLVTAINVLSEARKRRFLRRRQPKYGSMNKGFTEEELVKFFNALEDPKAILLFSYQAVLGLRIGEVVRIHIKDLNLRTKELRIDTEKGKTTDYLPIPQQLFEQTMKYINDYEDEIVKRKGYVFWADFYPERNDCPYISTDYARILFMKAIVKAKLDETYAIADARTPRLLHRLTTHSLRHYAITRHSQKNNGNIVLTSKFARHHNLETTMIYVHTGKEEFYNSVLHAQEDGILSKVRKLQEEI